MESVQSSCHVSLKWLKLLDKPPPRTSRTPSTDWAQLRVARPLSIHSAPPRILPGCLPRKQTGGSWKWRQIVMCWASKIRCSPSKLNAVLRYTTRVGQRPPTHTVHTTPTQLLLFSFCFFQTSARKSCITTTKSSVWNWFKYFAVFRWHLTHTKLFILRFLYFYLIH